MPTGIRTKSLLLAISIMVLSLSAHSRDSGARQRPSYPKVLRGVWDVAPYDCFASRRDTSDTIFEIGTRILQGYENTDELRSIEKISNSPTAWRVVTISNVAPPEIQGGADIYILDGKYLTISNGSEAETYVRCK